MCFHSQQSKSAQELEHRFHAKFEKGHAFAPAVYNGFQFPETPVITNAASDTIQLFNWGLIPHWAKDPAIRKNLLNARSETVNEKPAFRDVVSKRCLVLVDGFYEWQWLDEKGRNKQKYLITLPGNQAFAFAGLWSEWTDKSTGEVVHTYTILTCNANELMSKIHNTKKRMPLILPKSQEKLWLNGQQTDLEDIELVATEV